MIDDTRQAKLKASKSLNIAVFFIVSLEAAPEEHWEKSVLVML